MIPEAEVAARLGKTRQTLRNWRKGYWSSDTNGNDVWHEPRLTDGIWKKIGNTVVYKTEWVTEMENIKHDTHRLFKNSPES